jgi:hypothetical protein
MGVALAPGLALLGEAAASDPSSGRHPRRACRRLFLDGVGRNRESNVVFFSLPFPLAMGFFCVAFVGPYREYHGPEDSSS